MSENETIPRRRRILRNPLPAVGRGVRRAATGLVHEDTMTLYVAAVAMVISYFGVYTFASKQDLPLPVLWPVSLDLAALATARIARRLHALGNDAWATRAAAFGIVVLSVALQVSTVNLPPLPAGASWGVIGAWLWTVLPAVVGHGWPPFSAYFLMELGLYLQRVKRRAILDAAEAERLVLEQARGETRNARRSRRAETDTIPPATESREEAPVVTPSLGVGEVALADQVLAALKGERPTKRSVMPIIRELRGSCSGDFALKVAGYLNSRSMTH